MCGALKVTFVETDTSESQPAPQKKSKPSSSKPKQSPVAAESSNSDSEDEDKPLEEEEEAADEDSDSDEEGDPSKLVHESVAAGGKTKSASGKVKFVPSEETAEQRDARTVFVGNVPVEVVKSRVRPCTPRSRSAFLICIICSATAQTV